MTGSRPLPVPDEASAPYWEAAARHVLALPRCSGCRAWSLPPDVTCPRCHRTDPAWAYEPVTGRGTVRSWTVVRRSFVPGFDGDVPFVLVDVELDDQADLRMIGRLLGGPGALGGDGGRGGDGRGALRVGDRVAVAFEDVARGVAVPAFVREAA